MDTDSEAEGDVNLLEPLPGFPLNGVHDLNPRLPHLLWHLTGLTPSSRALGPLPFLGDFAGLSLPSRGKRLCLLCQLSAQPRVRFQLKCHWSEEAFPVSPVAIIFPHLGAHWPWPPEHLTQVTMTHFIAWSRAVWWHSH